MKPWRRALEALTPIHSSARYYGRRRGSYQPRSRPGLPLAGVGTQPRVPTTRPALHSEERAGSFSTKVLARRAPHPRQPPETGLRASSVFGYDRGWHGRVELIAEPRLDAVFDLNDRLSEVLTVGNPGTESELMANMLE